MRRCMPLGVRPQETFDGEGARGIIRSTIAAVPGGFVAVRPAVVELDAATAMGGINVEARFECVAGTVREGGVKA